MSTVVVVKKNGRACIGADTLTKRGYEKASAEYIANYSKILKFGNTYFATVGLTVWQQVLTSYFGQMKRLPSFRSASAIFEAIRRMHPVLRDDYFLRPEEQDDDEFESSRLDTLIANPYGIFGLHSLRAVQEFGKFYAFGSGSGYAIGAMYAVYDTHDSAEEIARIGLEAGAEFDDGTGAPFELYTLKLRRAK